MTGEPGQAAVNGSFTVLGLTLSIVETPPHLSQESPSINPVLFPAFPRGDQ
jgi:hypothetical protein